MARHLRQARPALLGFATLCIATPLLFLAIYAFVFRYDARIIVPGLLVVHTALATLALITLFLAWWRDPRHSRIS